MTVALDRPLQQKALTFDEFVAQYGGDKRYELIDGEVFDLEPTGPHEEVAGFITQKICFQIELVQIPWTVFQRPLFRPPHIDMTAFRPDVAVIDRTELVHEPLWPEESILTRGSSIRFVAEVVSSNWQNDYSRKMEDYATLGIPEYWIADHRGLGGVKYIGQPKQPTLSICLLDDGEYKVQILRGEEAIVSPTFPGLNLTAEQVLRAGN
ncbi:MAG: Uma2 family endonuclease [Alkalinema sp. RU_4_3]|nr:Uma2 family endonuclease [Alkalinema sp. RU_4_3]